MFLWGTGITGVEKRGDTHHRERALLCPEPPAGKEALIGGMFLRRLLRPFLRSRVDRALEDLVVTGDVVRTGSGTKDDPYLYELADRAWG